MTFRTHYCGSIDKNNIGQEVAIAGWIHRRRDHGGVIFFDIRDETGLIRVVYNPDNKDSFSLAETCRSEFVLLSKGTVRERPEGTVNPDLLSGEIEINASGLTILNHSLALPFQLDEHASVGEETRLKYRFLDLRRDAMQTKLRLRAKVSHSLSISFFKKFFER